MITAFSFLSGMTAVRYKKSQISYTEDIVFLAQRIILLLKNTAPDTDVIMSKLQSEPRLEKYDLYNIDSYSPLEKKETANISELFEVIGKYDAETQIKYLEEYSAHFEELKKQYAENFNMRKGLYMSFSVSAGIIVSLMLI